MMLDALEELRGHKEKIERAKLTIEHVMPQTLGDDSDGAAWRKALGDDWNSVHRELLHTLGISRSPATILSSPSVHSTRSDEFSRESFAPERVFHRPSGLGRRADICPRRSVGVRALQAVAPPGRGPTIQDRDR